MKLTNLACAAVAAILVAVAPTAPALAGIDDTYVSITGSDANSCSITAPCLTISRAVSQTVSGGVLHCLDSSDYGGAVITTSITIDCSNTTAGGGGFIINGSSIIVHIRGLIMWGLGIAINFENGAALYVENCVMFNNDTNGIVFEPSAAANLFVSNSTIRNNGLAGTVAAIHVLPASGVQASVTIEHSRIEGNYFGIIADGNSGGIINGVIRDSVVSNNTENGITASTTRSNVLLIIDQTTVAGNFHGLVAGGSTAAMMVRNTTVTGNTAAGLFTVNGGALYSYGNNSVDGNSNNNGTFTGPATLK
jgi:hypothetical protein